MENEANDLTDPFVARRTTDPGLRLELLCSFRNFCKKCSYYVFSTQDAGLCKTPKNFVFNFLNNCVINFERACR